MDAKNMVETFNNLTDAELKVLLLEIEKIGNETATALQPMSKKLTELFGFFDYGTFMDKFHNVNIQLQVEVINRFKKGTLRVD